MGHCGGVAMMVDMGELLRTCAALVGILAAFMAGWMWVMRSTIRAEVQPLIQRLDGLHHDHTETRRRVENLETDVKRLHDDKIGHGEVDARIELGLSRIRTGAPPATK